VVRTQGLLKLSQVRLCGIQGGQNGHIRRSLLDLMRRIDAVLNGQAERHRRIGLRCISTATGELQNVS
jgi:hypothetical protein